MSADNGNIMNDYGQSLMPPKGGTDKFLAHLTNYFSGPSGGEALASNLPQDVSAESVLGAQQPDPTQGGVPGASPIDPELNALSHGEARINALEGELRAGHKQDQEHMDRLQQEQKLAGDLKVKAAEERTAVEAPMLEQIHRDFDALDQKQKTIQATTQAATDAQMAKWDAARTDAANTQLHDFFADKSVAGHVVGLVSAALGGFANGLSGNPGAPTALDRIIQRDMDIQIQNLNQKNRTAAGEESKLRILMQSGLNQLEAVSALRAAVNDKVKLIALDVSNRMGTADAKAQAAQIAANADAENERIRQASASNYWAQRVALEGKAQGLEIASARLVASIAKGAVAQQKDSLAADVDDFQGSPIERAAMARQVTALKTLYSLSQDSDNNLAPFANANRRTAMQNALAEIYSNGTPAARGQANTQAQETIGGRYTGLFTDTADRRHLTLKDAREKVLNSLGTGKARGEFAAVLDKIGNLQ